MTQHLQNSDQSYLSQIIAEQGKSQIAQTVFQDNLKNLENSRQLLKQHTPAGSLASQIQQQQEFHVDIPPDQKAGEWRHQELS